MSLLDFCLNVSAIFSKGVKFGNVLCKVIVKLGKLNLGNSVYTALEASFLASKLFCMIVSRERNVYVELITDLVACNLLLKAGNEGAGAELKGVVLTLAALKSNTVDFVTARTLTVA